MSMGQMRISKFLPPLSLSFSISIYLFFLPFSLFLIRIHWNEIYGITNSLLTSKDSPRIWSIEAKNNSFSLSLSLILSLSIYLSFYLSIYLSTYLSLWVRLFRSTFTSVKMAEPVHKMSDKNDKMASAFGSRAFPKAEDSHFECYQRLQFVRSSVIQGSRRFT